MATLNFLNIACERAGSKLTKITQKTKIHFFRHYRYILLEQVTHVVFAAKLRKKEEVATMEAP